MSISAEEKRKIVEKHFDMVYRLAFSQTRDKSHADDVVQEVFLRFIKQEKTFESDEHIKAWLIRVTVNCCHNVFADLWHKRTAPLSEREDVPVFDTVEESDVYSAVQTLPEKYRVVIHLFYYEDMSIEDISKALGMKSSTVKSHLHRGRNLLRENWKESMILFRKHYKNAYDKIEPNHEIIDKVFEKAETKGKSKVYTFAMRYGVVAAVVALVIVSAKFYPVIVPTQPDDVSMQNIYITEESDEKQAIDVESTATPVTANEKTKNSALLRDTAEVEFTSAEKKDFFMFDEFAEVSETEEEIVYNFLVDKLGEKDEDLGHPFSFGIVGKTQYESNNFYLGRWSWLVNGDHMSLLCEFVLSEDMNEMYEVLYEGDKIIPLYENPLF